MFPTNASRAKPFAAGGCPVPEGTTKCGETRTLDIINEFKKLYQDKMKEIENNNCGDCLQEKVKLQQNWISDLTEQNEMLVRAVQELEIEATERVKLLEDKLQKSAECVCQIMRKYAENDVTNNLLEEPRKKIFNLENDLKNLLEFVRRIRDEDQWSTGGLTFYEITEKELFGTKNEAEIINWYLNSDIKKEKNKIKEQQSHIQSLEKRVIQFDCLTKEIESKRAECESLRKDMIDMRQALTEEVATKHDAILKLKRECQELEDRCIQADKQTAFRDDIIKELRKEIKQLKQQENKCLMEDGRNMVERLLDLGSELELAKYKIDFTLDQIERNLLIKENSTEDTFMKQLNNLTASSIRDNLYSFMEKEIVELNKIVDIKHNQLQELFELNKILIRQMFSANSGLKFLEERAVSTLVRCLENESCALKSENVKLEEKSLIFGRENSDLLEKINEAKSTIQSLEKQFNNFLQEKDQLKIKYKEAVRQGSCLLEECNRIKTENCHLNTECDKLKKEFDLCCKDKNILQDKWKEMREEFNKLLENKDECFCQNNQLLQENKKFAKELKHVNELNENLLSTISGLRGQLNATNKITTDEVIKLNKTIDVLQTTLEQGKVMQEVEEKDAQAEINCLRIKIKELEDCISKKNEEIHVKNEKNISLKNKMKDLEFSVSKWKKHTKEKETEMLKLCSTLKNLEKFVESCSHQIQESENEISNLRKTVADSENRVCGCKKQLQNKNAEISTLNDNIKELESCIFGLKDQLKAEYDEKASLTHKIVDLEKYINGLEEKCKNFENVEMLKNKIKALECCLLQLQSKSKICKICKQSIKVTFCDCAEVQTEAQESTEEQLELLEDRDDLIRYQGDTLEKMQEELKLLSAKEKEYLAQKETFINDKIVLQNKIALLEGKIEEYQKNADLLSNKEEIIMKQKEALHIMQKESEELRARESEMKQENDHCRTSIQQLKNKINELEKSVQIAERRANNLQMAVDLYTNTINVLEASEEKYKLEIEHQRTTISNLQDALVTNKQELDDCRQKIDDSVEDHRKLFESFFQIISENEAEKNILKNELCDIHEKYEKLQELNFSVEMEYCTSLQDIEGLDRKLFKYQNLLKRSENELKICKNSLRKLMKQKICFEEVIQYFKAEMAVMAKQLQNLQGLLNMSHEAAQEETSKLIQAFYEVQELNKQLSTQLSAAEQKVTLENQMNQLNEAKISKLQKTINDKDFDIKIHTTTIQCIKRNLKLSMKQNEDLQKAVVSLNKTVAEFQSVVEKYEEDNRKSKENTALCQSQISICREKLINLSQILDQKTLELANLETAYTKQQKSLKCYQTVLSKLKEKQKSKLIYLKNVIEQLKKQLSKDQDEKNKVIQELNETREQLGIVKTRDSIKGVEIGKYKELVADMKGTLVELNQLLGRKGFLPQKNSHNETCQKYVEQETRDQQTNTSQEDISFNCPCEIEFYTNILAKLNESISELKKRLFTSQRKNHELEEEIHQKALQIEEMSQIQLQKDEEYNEMKQKLFDSLEQAEIEQCNYAEVREKLDKEISCLKQELDFKTVEIEEMERKCQEINGSRNVQLVVAEDEITRLRKQMSELLKQQHVANIENEKLQNQTTMFESKIQILEETSSCLRSEIEQQIQELQAMQKERDSLHQKNQDLLYELRSLSNQQRYKEETIKNLEYRLSEIKCSRDEICAESKHAVEYFRKWLLEQNKINKRIVDKERAYCKTIDCLKHRIQQTQYNSYGRYFSKCVSPPCSLGSQGNESVFDESPSKSPCPCDPDNYWYAANFKDESETDLDDDEDWVSKVEHLAEQVRRTNKMWKNKMEKSDFAVTKDSKK